jgi:hypothetical protein
MSKRWKDVSVEIPEFVKLIEYQGSLQFLILAVMT